jgi:hypothetical protein
MPTTFSSEETKTYPLEALQKFAFTNTLYTTEPSAKEVTASLGWQLPAEPLALTPEQADFIKGLGLKLWQFSLALERLYQEASLPESAYAWVAQLLEQGKPAALLKQMQASYSQGQRPLVIRPDLLLTEAGWALCEIDAVPGGMGFTSALAQAYRTCGFPLLEADAEQGFVGSFARWLAQLPLPVNGEALTSHTVGIVVSDEAESYRLELQWLAEALKSQSNTDVSVLHPSQLVLGQQAGQAAEQANCLGFYDKAGVWRRLSLVYRFFELFDLPNVQHFAALEAALQAGTVTLTPPLQPIFEEKLCLALLHQPALSAFWQAALPPDTLATLLQIVPKSWVLEPATLVATDLKAQGQPIKQFSDLAKASQKERQLVVKPSGFSPLAWGSRGLTVGHDVPTVVWEQRLQAALDSFGETPYLLQRFEKPKLVPLNRLDLETLESTPTEGRIRLCPYYLVFEGGMVELAGTLATACPKDKKVIHGMKVAMMMPAWVKSL